MTYATLMCRIGNAIFVGPGGYALASLAGFKIIQSCKTFREMNSKGQNTFIIVLGVLGAIVGVIVDYLFGPQICG